MVSARRPPSSMPDIDVRISGGIFLLSFTYWSNCVRQRAAHRLDFVRRTGVAGCDVGFGDDMVFTVVGDVTDARALRAFDQHLDGAVGQLQHLQHRGDAADVVQVVGGRLVLGRRLLRDQQDVLAGFHRDVERLDRLRAADEQRNHHVRKDDDVAQRQQRQRRR